MKCADGVLSGLGCAVMVLCAMNVELDVSGG